MDFKPSRQLQLKLLAVFVLLPVSLIVLGGVALFYGLDGALKAVGPVAAVASGFWLVARIRSRPSN
jgi:hypothetical protein